MSFKLCKLSKVLSLTACWAFLYSPHSSSEIYQWVDSQGRLQFSDSPEKIYGSSGYAHSDNSNASSSSTPKYEELKNLKGIAKELERDRLKRATIRDEEDKAWVKKNKKRKKRLAAIKKNKLACQKAQDNEDLAFRKRTQRQGLMQMRKALANYEIKRELRRKNCK
ncbi:MAG: hypothetical protein ACJAYV_000546 [Oleispira sp.]|jgi:hypothetical protein